MFVLPFGLAKQLKPLGLGNPSYQTLHQFNRINCAGSDLWLATYAPSLVHRVHDASQPSRQARFRTVHIFVLPFGLAKQLNPLGPGIPS